MARIILVHGEKPDPKNHLRPEFKERLDKTLSLSQTHHIDYIVILGGQTQPTVPSESEIGSQYLKPKTKLPILLEPKSKNTGENIMFAKELLKDKQVNKIYVITSQSRLFRIKYLYQRLWPKMFPNIEFVSTKDYYPFYFPILEFIYFLVDIFDPEGKTLEDIAKVIFRNGQLRSLPTTSD